MKPANVRFLAVAVAVALAACGAGSAENEAVEEADDSVQSASLESALTASFTEVATSAASDAAYAEAQAQAAPQEFTTPSCVQAVQQGAKVTYTMTACTGSYGLVNVSGTVVVTYKLVPGGVQATATGSGITINSATVNLDVVATRKVISNVTTIQVTTKTGGVGRRGNGADRTGDYTVTVDPVGECITIDGTWQTKVGLKSATTVVSGYKQCKGRCPVANGVVTQTYTSGAVASMQFDGSAIAAWSYTSGTINRSGTLSLMCQP